MRATGGPHLSSAGAGASSTALLAGLALATVLVAYHANGDALWTPIGPGELAARLAVTHLFPLVLDLRQRSEYLSGTVHAARHAGPFPDKAAPAAAISGDVVLLPPEPPDPESIEAWSKYLTAAGASVHVLVGGMDAWRAAGLPVEIPGPDFATPGQFPFLIPRGLCEHREPVQQFPGREGNGRKAAPPAGSPGSMP